MPASPTDRRPAESPDRWWAAALIGAGVIALVLAGGIRASSLPGNHDPGPRSFPILMGSLLVLGGLLEMIPRRRRARSRNETAANPDTSGPPAPENDPEPAGLSPEKPQSLIWFFAALLGLLLLMPLVGFFPSAGLFSLGVMRRWQTSWRTAAVATGLLLGAVYALFVLVFRVPLPSGGLF
jgi:putative tricarboxylic transport membrane protein